MWIMCRMYRYRHRYIANTTSQNQDIHSAAPYEALELCAQYTTAHKTSLLYLNCVRKFSCDTIDTGTHNSRTIRIIRAHTEKKRERDWETDEICNHRCNAIYSKNESTSHTMMTPGPK